MFVIRWLLGRIILLMNAIFAPSARKHTPEATEKLAVALAGITLYHYPACPFCVKVRRAMKRNGIELPLTNAKHNEAAKQELLEQGGKLMVPCLRIERAGNVEWMYESSDIIDYLNNTVEDCY